VFRAPSSPLADALALEYLEREGRRQAYGQLRLWGSIGFAITSLATGALVLGADLVWLVYLYAASVFALALVSLTLPEGRAERRPTLAAGRDALREHPRLFVFLVGMTLVGMTLGIVNSYQIVYLDDIRAPGWVSGLVFAATGIIEAGLMQLGGPLIRRWGLRAVFLAGVALMVPRWVLYVFIEDPLWVVPTQLLHSIGMLSLLVAGVLLVDQQLGGRWRATSQTLYQAALQGVGSAFGLVIAGVLYEWSGIDMVWWACAAAGSLGLLVLIWATRGTPMRTIETRGS
jgi:MFS family permease